MYFVPSTTYEVVPAPIPVNVSSVVVRVPVVTVPEAAARVKVEPS